MRCLTLGEILKLHADLIATSGGSSGVRDLGRVQSALAQPMATFEGVELYPSLAEKAAALGFALIQGHPFIDGNKRIEHAALKCLWCSMGSSCLSRWTSRSRRFLQ
jgi:death on curing protein